MGKFLIDHDLHIHSQLSLCSNDPLQTPERILRYAQANGLKNICLTDHFWDEKVPGASSFDFYARQDFAHVTQALPLPQSDSVRFHFGCETDIDKFLHLGLSRERMDCFEFIIVPTTHLHMIGFTTDADRDDIPQRAEIYLKRLWALLRMDLPFEKIGIAHLTCPLIAPGDFANHIALINRISDAEFRRAFDAVAEKRAGVELNFTLSKYSGQDRDDILRPYRIAKSCGCRFYFGSDAHHPAELDGAMQNFEEIAGALALQEEDKFAFPQH